MLRSFGLLIPIALVACGSSSDSSSGPPPFAIAEASTFIEPWAMTFQRPGGAIEAPSRQAELERTGLPKRELIHPKQRFAGGP